VKVRHTQENLGTVGLLFLQDKVPAEVPEVNIHTNFQMFQNFL